jgi:hypothetical protein
MSMCVCARMRKVDRLDEIGDAPLKEKKDEVTFAPTSLSGFSLNLFLYACSNERVANYIAA